MLGERASEKNIRTMGSHDISEIAEFDTHVDYDR